MEQERVNGPIVVNVRLPPAQVLLRIFVGIFDTVDLVAQAVSLVEKGGRAGAHDLEMLFVAGQEVLPTRNACHGHLTQLPQRSAERHALMSIAG